MRAYTVYQTSCFCPATLLAGRKGSLLAGVVDITRRNDVQGAVEIRDMINGVLYNFKGCRMPIG